MLMIPISIRGLGRVSRVRAGMTSPLQTTSGHRGVGLVLGSYWRLLTLGFAWTPWTTQDYVEKVRSQFFSLRQLQRSPNFCVDEKAENLPISGGFSRTRTVLEISELHLYGRGDSIFLQTFVLRHFGIVQKDQEPEG
jgi:hypothetical protein